jgi:hypothetical protein
VGFEAPEKVVRASLSPLGPQRPKATGCRREHLGAIAPLRHGTHQLVPQTQPLAALSAFMSHFSCDTWSLESVTCFLPVGETLGSPHAHRCPQSPRERPATPVFRDKLAVKVLAVPKGHIQKTESQDTGDTQSGFGVSLSLSLSLSSKHTEMQPFLQKPPNVTANSHTSPHLP